jgi:hypothetical protein
MRPSKKILFSVLAFVLMVLLQVIYRHFISSGDDFYFPICGARTLLSGGDPYASCHVIFDHEYPQNPMTTILAALPFAWLGDTAGGIALFSVTVALLVFGILSNGQPWQLLVFTSLPFWHSFYAQQWSVLFAAIYMMPVLLPLSIIKPQQAIPLVLTKLTPRRLIGILIFFLLSIAAYPSWLVKWLPQALGTYGGFIPVLVFPGIFLLLAFINWRKPEARFLGFFALSPQNKFYDQTMLWLLLDRPWKMVVLSLCSWMVPILSTLYPVTPALWIVICEYIPALLLVVDWQELSRIGKRTQPTFLNSIRRPAK